MCTCPTQFPMVRISDGKYRVGDKIVIFLRILRNHIMVRVGGGWDTLEHYLDKHDPCRCRLHNLQSAHNQRQFGSVSKLKGQTVPYTNTPMNSSHRKISSNFRLANTTNNNSENNNELSNDSSLERQVRKLSGIALPNSKYNRRISSSVSMTWLPIVSPNSRSQNQS